MSLLSILFGFWHYGLAAILAVGAVAAIIYLPGKFGGAVAAVVGAIAAAVLAYQLGFQARGALDASEGLRAQLQQAQKDIENATLVAQAANERERATAAKLQADNEKVQGYVASVKADLDISGAELERLRGLVDRHQADTARATAAVRSASSASVGCKVTLARYIAALNEANRRLINDGAFYSDVRARFSK